MGSAAYIPDKPSFLNPAVADSMIKESRRLFEAAQGGDVDFALAVLTTLQNNLPSYIKGVKEFEA